MSANELSASAARREIAAGRLKPVDLLEACLARIDERQEKVGAWEHLDPDQARQAAANLDPKNSDKPLYGLPFGIKDIIDLAGMPRRNGSPIYRDNVATSDASCVALAREAGAIFPGKTVTTEFAYFGPGKTTNPHNPAHTPGGSSSGSAAALADFQVPLAYGTQTAGSVIRPAAYCGVYGFKPSQGFLNLAGINPLAPQFDCLGMFAREVEDFGLPMAALMGTPIDISPMKPVRLGILRPVEWVHASQEMQNAVQKTVEAAAKAGVKVREIHLDRPFARLNAAHKTIMFHDMRRSLAHEYSHHNEQLTGALRTALNLGEKVTFPELMEAMTLRAACQASIARIFETCEILLMPSAPGPAPLGLDSTGDPIFNRLPTFLGLPCVNLCGHKDADGMPLGVQIIGPYSADMPFLKIAAWLAQQIGD